MEYDKRTWRGQVVEGETSETRKRSTTTFPPHENVVVFDPLAGLSQVRVELVLHVHLDVSDRSDYVEHVDVAAGLRSCEQKH
jgi:hypothetical protein